MTWSAAGSFLQTTGSGGSASLFTSPVAVGNVVFLGILTYSSGGNTDTVTGITGGNYTWAQIGTVVQDTTGFGYGTLVFWQGTATATGSSSATITATSSSDFLYCAGFEYHSTVGAWSVDAQGHIDTTSSNPDWPTLTPSGSGRLYVGYSYSPAGAVAGSTPGFVYEIDNNGFGYGYDLSVGAAYTPVWGDTDQIFVIAFLIEESGSASTPSPLVRSRPLHGPAGARAGRLLRPTAGRPPHPAAPPRPRLLHGQAVARPGRLLRPTAGRVPVPPTTPAPLVPLHAFHGPPGARAGRLLRPTTGIVSAPVPPPSPFFPPRFMRATGIRAVTGRFLRPATGKITPVPPPSGAIPIASGDILKPWRKHRWPRGTGIEPLDLLAVLDQVTGATAGDLPSQLPGQDQDRRATGNGLLGQMGDAFSALGAAAARRGARAADTGAALQDPQLAESVFYWQQQRTTRRARKKGGKHD